MFINRLLLLVAAAVPLWVNAAPNPPFRTVTAAQAWTEMNPGWNLGNTLDAVPDEGSWNNPKVAEYTFDDIKKAKFKSVRIPVTWTDHFASEGPHWNVSTAWMDRVEQVVDFALKRDLYTVLNVHHDSWQWADYSTFFSDPITYAARTEKFVKLWQQIAARFKNKSHLLIFEPLNEPAGYSAQEVAAQYNTINQIFVDIVRSSGGNNAKRLLTLPGLNTNIQRTVDWFVEPTNVGNYILHVHDYDPWAFVSTSWGRTFWGTDSDKKEIEDTFIALQNKFQAPALIGEWGLTGQVIERGAAWRYFDFFVRTSRKYNLAAQLWDNGNDHFDRAARKWRDPVKLAIIQSAVKGINNTLPALNQEPVLYFVQGEAASDKEILLDFAGNKISGVYELASNGHQSYLRANTDYTVTSTGITFKQSYLAAKLAAKPNTLGLLHTVYVVPRKGASFDITLRRYAVPTLNPAPPANATSPTVLTITEPSNSFLIPVSFQGTSLATVKAVIKSTGEGLKDSWTQWLGPLEQQRLSWGGDFEPDSQGVWLTASTVQAIAALGAGDKAEVTLEFWPRISGNNVTVLIGV